MKDHPQELKHKATSDREKLTTQLSLREVEVFSLLADGNSNKEIAHALYISPHTVKSHIAHIYEALELASRTEAVLFWIRALQEER